MYPINSASPQRIAIGSVVLIADGTVQTSGVSIKVLPFGTTASAGGGTTGYEEGIVHYTPTQAETNYTSFVLIAYKTGCIPATVTVVTTASAVAGYAGLDWGVMTQKTATNALTNTTVGTVTAVTGLTASDVGAIKTKTDFLPSTTAGAAGGLFIAGSNAATTYASLTVTGITTLTGNVALADGLAIAAPSTANRTGLSISGVGTGSGVLIEGGATGHAVNILGGATSGNGISLSTTSGDGFAISATDGHGLLLSANGTSKHGLYAGGGTAGASDGIRAVAGFGGVDIRGNLEGTVTSAGSVTGSVGSVTGAVGSVTATVSANIVSISGDITAADNAEAFFDGTGYAGTNNVIPTVLDATVSSIYGGVINDTALDVTALAVIADAVWDEAIAGHLTAGTTGAALNGAGSAGDPWTTPLPGAYGAGTAGKIIGDNINATVSSRATQTSVDAIDDLLDTEVAAIKAKTDLIPAAPAAVGDIPTASAIADQVWDEAISGHLGVGSTGEALDAASSGGDPWGTALPGAYGAGTAGNIIGNRLDVASSTLATAANLATVAGYLDTEVAAIKAKTDNLPAAPAAVGDIPTVTSILTTAITEAYRVNGAAPTLAQFMSETLAHLGEASISGTVKTIKKLDHSTTAETFTLDSATTPTSITRAS